MKTYTIYKATCKTNNKVYIGFTSRWPQRINGHNYDRRYSKTNKAFYNAIKKYGWDNFEWEAIYQSQDYGHTLTEMEPYFINEYRSWVGFNDCNGYNTTRGGEGATGYKRTPELIESHRAKLKGVPKTPEHIANMKKTRAEKIKENPNYCKWNLGKKHSPESIEKMRLAQQGIPKSEAHKQAMRNRPQDTTTVVCPHCLKEGDYKNMKRWHFDRCKLNSDRIDDLSKIVTCGVCGHTAKQSPNFYRNHNEHCKSKT